MCTAGTAHLHQRPPQRLPVPVKVDQLVVAGAAHGLPRVARVHALNQHLRSGRARTHVMRSMSEGEARLWSSAAQQRATRATPQGGCNALRQCSTTPLPCRPPLQPTTPSAAHCLGTGAIGTHYDSPPPPHPPTPPHPPPPILPPHLQVTPRKALRALLRHTVHHRIQAVQPVRLDQVGHLGREREGEGSGQEHSTPPNARTGASWPATAACAGTGSAQAAALLSSKAKSKGRAEQGPTWFSQAAAGVPGRGE